MRRLLLLTGTIVLVDTLFFAALTPLLPHYAHRLGLGKGGAESDKQIYRFRDSGPSRVSRADPETPRPSIIP